MAPPKLTCLKCGSDNSSVPISRTSNCCDNCVEEALHAERLEILRKSMPQQLASCGVPPRYQGARRADFNDWPEELSEWPLIGQDLPDSYAEWDQVGSLIYLHGKHGTGKTHMATALLARFIAYGGEGGRWVDVGSMTEAMRREIDSRSGDLLSELQRSTVLVLDDLGSQRDTEFTSDRVAQLLRYRYNNGLPTVVTSNYSIEKLVTRQKVDVRLASRLAHGVLEVELDGPNRRLR